MEDVMNMMEENEEGEMEFPRDLMLEDCFAGSEEPLYGFVSNITIPEDMLKPCLVDIECYENGTDINATGSVQEDFVNIDLVSPTPETIRRQGIINEAVYYYP
jgi:hypothetical protein